MLPIIYNSRLFCEPSVQEMSHHAFFQENKIMLYSEREQVDYFVNIFSRATVRLSGCLREIVPKIFIFFTTSSAVYHLILL